MRYIADSSGYVKQVSFGADIVCDGQHCTEYVGAVPSGYASLEAWYLAEVEKLYRWKIVSGNLTLDSSAVAPTNAPLSIGCGGTGATTAAKALTNLGGVSMKKLWTNGSLTSQFAAQALAIAWADYDKIGVEYQYSDTATDSAYEEIACKTNARILMKGTYLSTSRVPQFGERSMFLTSGKVNFTQGYIGLASGNAQVSNWYCIPVAVYGIKGVK